MGDACRAFRDAWEHGGAHGSVHPTTCPPCARWAEAHGRLVTALAGLGRLAAPPELVARVESELAGNRSRRLQRVLESLVRRGAPALLDERVADVLRRQTGGGDAERGARKAEALRALDVQRAPPVLERLLDEELAAPERHRAERFSHDLERLAAPEALAERIASSVRRRAWARTVLGPLSALAAAGLVVWVALRGEPEPRPYRFQVSHAASLEGLDPMARALAESLGGGGPR